MLFEVWLAVNGKPGNAGSWRLRVSGLLKKY